MKYVALFGVLVMIGFTFQNCGKDGFQTTAPEESLDLEGVESLGPLVQQGTDNYPLVRKSQEHDHTMGDNSGFTEIVVNLNKETVEAQVKNSQKITKRLPKALVDKSKELFQSSSLCKAPESRGDRMCTMIYRFPYADLIDEASGVVIRLGEARDGCGTGSVDFCELTARQSFKEILSEITQNFDTFPEN